MGCSPIKAVRAGFRRRETVRSLSGAGVGYLRGAVSLVREDRDGLAAGASVDHQGHGRVAKPGRDKR